MRFDALRAVVAGAAVGLLALAAGCSGGGAAHSAAPPPSSSASSGAGYTAAVPGSIVMRGTLSIHVASTVYEAAIVPAYPLALQVAGTLALHPAAAPAALSNFTTRLSKALGSFSKVTAFPAQAEPAFATYRSIATALLASLARPSAVAASQQASRAAAMQLYALAQQIGVLGTDLNLVPAEQGGKH